MAVSAVLEREATGVIVLDGQAVILLIRKHPPKFRITLAHGVA
jgi:hypothetical protein